jgi:O-antigen/teichoic acid export membrane protein
MLFLAAAGLAVLAMMQAGAVGIAGLLNNPDLTAYTGLVGTFLFLSLVSAPLEMVMISRSRYGWAAGVYAGSDLLRAASLIATALVWRRLDAVFVGAVVFAFLRLCASLAWMLHEFGAGLRPHVAEMREQLAYAIPFGAAALLEVLQSNYHQFAVSHHFDAAAFAVYTVGVLQIPIVDFVAGPAGNVMMVRMGEAAAHGDAAGVRTVWYETTRRLAGVFLPLVCLLLVVANDLIVFLFTARYAGSVPVFRAWSLTIVLAVLQTDGVLRAFAQTRLLLKLSAFRLVLVVLLIFPFLSRFHLVGAAIATVLATAAAKLGGLARMRRLMGVGLRGLLPWRALAGTLIVAAAAAGVALLVREHLAGTAPLVVLIATGASYSAAYLLLGYALLWGGGFSVPALNWARSVEEA